MKHQQTTGIVLSRTDYGEADRILTVLTPDYGKLRLLARGVRKVKSKLAGGIELFSVSQISFMQGRGDLGTLVSTRLNRHYGHIINDIERVQLGYQLLKQFNRATEDHPEAEYFRLLEQAFEALDNREVDSQLLTVWFQAQLLKLAGHSPNLKTDSAGTQLQQDQKYNFDIEHMTFAIQPKGKYQADDIKSLRLVFSGQTPSKLNRVSGLAPTLTKLQPLVNAMLTSYIRV